MEQFLESDIGATDPLDSLLTANQRWQYEWDDGYDPFTDIATEPLPPDDGPREWYWVRTFCESKGGFEHLTAAVAQEMVEMGWFVVKQWPPCGPAFWRLKED